jgi:uncharacterized protein (TIGR02594 family)
MSQWDQEYRSLPPEAKSAVNDLVNAIFRDQTGVGGKIDPHTQPQLAAKWIEIRDQVLENRQQFGHWIKGTAAALANMAQAVGIYNALDTTPAWIRTARGEIGQHEIAGPTHNPRIMQYIRTCTNIQQTEAQRKYVEREGEEGVEWCSAFVNWCLQQAGIVGTNNALAGSWATWGTRLAGPRCGAIVCFDWNSDGRLDHVAFCDEDDRGFKMLGGNQTGFGGQVSSVGFSTSAAKHYRWPDTA